MLLLSKLRSIWPMAISMVLLGLAHHAGAKECTFAIKAATGKTHCASSRAITVAADSQSTADRLLIDAMPAQRCAKSKFGFRSRMLVVAEEKSLNLGGTNAFTSKAHGLSQFAITLPWIDFGNAARSAKAKKLHQYVQSHGALSHELGHILLLQASSNKTETKEMAQSDALTYGAEGAPDWLDELAAISCEGTSPKSSQLNHMLNRLIANSPANALPKVSELLNKFKIAPTMELSEADLVELASGLAKGESKIAVITPGSPIFERLAKAPDMGSDIQSAYDFGGLLHAYLEQKNALKMLLREYVQDAKRGEKFDFESWLGLQSKLPGTLATLDQDWLNWLQSLQRDAVQP